MNIIYIIEVKVFYKGYFLISLENDVDNGCLIGEFFIE